MHFLIHFLDERVLPLHVGLAVDGHGGGDLSGGMDHKVAGDLCIGAIENVSNVAALLESQHLARLVRDDHFILNSLESDLFEQVFAFRCFWDQVEDEGLSYL